MLAPLNFAVWYGPAMGSAVEVSAADIAAGITGDARPGMDGAGAGAVTLADATTLKHRPMSTSGAGVVTTALPKARARPSLHVKVNELSQDDVVGAVQQMRVEGDTTLVEALRLILAVLQGDATGLDGNPTFKSLDGSKTRIAGTIVDGARTVTTRDAT